MVSVLAPGAASACENRLPRKLEHIMDVEHINAIGHELEDLIERTAALRGYL